MYYNQLLLTCPFRAEHEALPCLAVVVDSGLYIFCNIKKVSEVSVRVGALMSRWPINYLKPSLMPLLIPAVHQMESADDCGLDPSFTLLRGISAYSINLQQQAYSDLLC